MCIKLSEGKQIVKERLVKYPSGFLDSHSWARPISKGKLKSFGAQFQHKGSQFLRLEIGLKM